MNASNDLKFYVSGYVWITLGWYHDQWWTEDVSQDVIPGCSDILLEPLMSQTISIQQANSAPDINAPTDVNLVNYLPIKNKLNYFQQSNRA